jgi:hypothetical protein
MRSIVFSPELGYRLGNSLIPRAALVASATAAALPLGALSRVSADSTVVPIWKRSDVSADPDSAVFAGELDRFRAEIVFIPQ